MKKMKLFTALLCCVFAVSIQAHAAGLPAFRLNPTADSIENKESVYVLADLADNPGFGALQLCISYDPETLFLEDAALGEIIPADAITSINTDIPGEINFSVISLENITESGTVLVSKFTAQKSGSAKLDLKLLAYADSGGTSLDANASDAEIQIGSADSKTEDQGSSGGGSLSTGGKGSAKTDQPEKTEQEKQPFSDVLNTHWAREYIKKAAELGIVSGYENGEFQPEKKMTRAEFATVLWNAAKKPSSSVKPHFQDVSENDWFYQQVAWGFEQGIINGTSQTTFSPNDPLSREQAMTILYRYSGSPDTENVLNRFIDSTDVSDYAKEAMSWAISNGIINGISETELSPKTGTTRAQLATIMVKFLNQ